MYIAIDIGGTTTRVASTKNLKEIYKSERFSSQDTVEKERFLLEKAIVQVADGQKVEAICAGIPGTVDQKDKKFNSLAHYPQLNGLPFTDLFSEKLLRALGGAKLHIQNDANLAGLGEAVFGAGKDFTVLAYLTLSTGVGGVRIANKKLDPLQKISEPGHMIVNFDEKLLEAENIQAVSVKGSLELYTAGTYFEQVYGVTPENCSDIGVWEKYANYLAVGIHNVLVMWNPDAVVLGGGITENFNLFYDYLIKALEELDFLAIPSILKAELGDDVGLYGGFAFLG